MTNRNVLRALFLATLALVFASGALQLPLGRLARPGPGLFPIVVSVLLFAVALAMLVQSRIRPAVSIEFNLKNVGLVASSLVAFVVVAHGVGMAAAIVALVCVASFASPPVSWQRTAAIATVLVLVAVLFQTFLGLNLRII